MGQFQLLQVERARAMDALAAALATRHRIAAKRMRTNGSGSRQVLETIPNPAAGNHGRVVIAVAAVFDAPDVYTYTDADTGRCFGRSDNLTGTAFEVAKVVRAPS